MIQVGLAIANAPAQPKKAWAASADAKTVEGTGRQPQECRGFVGFQDHCIASSVVAAHAAEDANHTHAETGVSK
jgi:hypothetical protein